MEQRNRKPSAFKNMLAFGMGIFGASITFNPLLGTPSFIARLTGHAEITQIVGILMMLFAILGLFLGYSPIRVWIIILPFACYTALTTWAILTVADPPIPSAVVLLFAPVGLAGAYIWERINND